MMKELYLLLDEWDNDRNFVGRELDLICDKFTVTIICNSASVELNKRARYFIYKRPGKGRAVMSLIRMMFDKDSWIEAGLVIKEKEGRFKKLSEAVRFYVNSDLFRNYMRQKGLLKDGVLYYSYWYFWKCYAVTHEIDKYKNSRIITRTHEYDLYDYTSPSGYQPFKESMDEKLDSVVFIAEHGRNYYLKKYNKNPRDKYKLYHLGTKDPYGKTGGVMRPYKKGDTLNLVSCSSIIERKRVDRIAMALSLIDDIKIKWLHFGSGDREEELKKLCRDRLYGKANIEYSLMGYVKNEDLHDHYKNNRTDIFVMASSSEGNPVSVMEAMSYGIPIIAPAVCNIPVMTEGCGILTSKECMPEELADAIRTLFGKPEEELIRLRERARKRYEDDFDSDKNNRRFLDEVLGKYMEK